MVPGPLPVGTPKPTSTPPCCQSMAALRSAALCAGRAGGLAPPHREEHANRGNIKRGHYLLRRLVHRTTIGGIGRYSHDSPPPVRLFQRDRIHMDGIIRTADEHPIRFDLLTENPVYKPFRYPWAYEAWLTQQRVHWLPEEVPLADDVKDWHRNLTDGERNLLTQIFRFFTQAGVEVNNCYMKHYSQVFKPTEVLMMLSAFSNIETVHIAAYSHLLDTVGMPEAEYTTFLKYKEMKDKYDYMHGFRVDNKHEIAKTLAAFGAFTEGLQLFASFAILLNFPRFNKMKGMGQIITWSVRDESLHCMSTIKLFRTFVQENPEIWTEQLREEIYISCATIIDHEDAFIDLAFEG